MNDVPDVAGDEKLVAENELCRFYQNNWTRSATEYGKSRNVANVAVLIAEQKSDKRRSYILVDTKSLKVLGDDLSYEGICCRMEMIGVAERMQSGEGEE